MTSLMNSEWGGVFHNPIMKHRLYTGDVSNHLAIISILPLDEIDEDEYDDTHEYGLDELTVLGDGMSEWLVEVGFVPNTTGQTYFYIINLNIGDAETTLESINDPSMRGAEIYTSDGLMRVADYKRMEPEDRPRVMLPDVHEALHLIGDDLRS